jgi:hypothetical protein
VVGPTNERNENGTREKGGKEISYEMGRGEGNRRRMMEIRKELFPA